MLKTWFNSNKWFFWIKKKVKRAKVSCKNWNCFSSNEFSAPNKSEWCVLVRNWNSYCTSCCTVWIRWRIWAQGHNSKTSATVWIHRSFHRTMTKANSLAMEMFALKVYYAFKRHTFVILCLPRIHTPNSLYHSHHLRWHCSLQIFCHELFPSNQHCHITHHAASLNFCRLVLVATTLHASYIDNCSR